MAVVQIYSASAGSGKTFTLVKEYLKILFKKAEANNYHAFGNIMAITFTNKATDEMKRRVIESLKSIATGHPSDLQKVLQSELPDIQDLQPLAHKILTRLLKDFSNFNIQTIDSFFQDIIRSFGRELNLPLNFEVELNLEKALEFAVDELICRIGIDPTITAWLTDYAHSRMEEDKGWNFKTQITEISRELFDENIDLEALQPTAANIGNIKKRLASIVLNFEKDLAAAGAAIFDDIKARGIPLEAYNSNWRRNIQKAVKAYRGLSISPSATYLKELSIEKSPLLKTSPKNFNIDEDAYKSEDYLRNSAHIFQLLTVDLRMYLAAKEARNNIYALGVIHELNEFLKRYRSEKNVLFIVDAARLLAGFITLDGMPFLFEKIGSRLEYLFIDEFQDTSAVQWNNMLPLIKNILSAAGSETSIMLVGDAKQSIYRWRGGDYRLITGMAAASIAPFQSETVRLDINYRSLPEIVEFNNRFFSAVKEMMSRSGNSALEQELGSAYEYVVQQCAATDDPGNRGKVTIELIEKVNREWKPNALTKMDNQIKSLCQAGYAYHDMAILVKTRNEGIEISRHLQRSGIDVISIETLLLKFDPDVKLLTAAMHYLSDADIPLNYVNLLWQYAQNKGMNEVSKSTIFSDFKKRSLLDKWVPELMARQEQLTHLSSYQAFEQLVTLLNVDESENQFLRHLRQIIFDFFRRDSTGLKDFLEWWKEQKDRVSIALENGRNKINILTIHKAKGLEFPAVLIPYCDWDFYTFMHKDILWLSDPELVDDVQLPYRAVGNLGKSIFEEAYDEERKWRWMDSINVLYVAMTRAQDVLYVSLPMENKDADFPKGAAKLIIEILSDWEIAIDQAGVAYENGELRKVKTEPDPAGNVNGDNIIHHTYSRRDTDADMRLRSSFENRETRIGNLVHDTLYFLSGSNDQHLKEALRKASNNSNYQVDEVDVAKKHLDHIVTQSEFQAWMAHSKNIWNEQDLYYNGNLYRPDKIIQMEDRFIVIDYKTGEHSDAYQHQVANYMAAVQTIFPDNNIDGYVLYTDDGSLDQVLV